MDNFIDSILKDFVEKVATTISKALEDLTNHNIEEDSSNDLSE